MFGTIQQELAGPEDPSMPKGFLSPCCFRGHTLPWVSVIILMVEFWEESITATFRCQELGDPVYFGDPSLILGTGWEGGFHICAEQSLLYLCSHSSKLQGFLPSWAHRPLLPGFAHFFWLFFFLQMLNLWNFSRETATEPYPSLGRKPPL